jgi:hypothetical protein
MELSRLRCADTTINSFKTDTGKKKCGVPLTPVRSYLSW